MLSEAALGLAGEAMVGVGTANSTVGLVEDLLGLLEDWSHFLDELLFAAILRLLVLEALDFLGNSFSIHARRR